MRKHLRNCHRFRPEAEAEKVTEAIKLLSEAKRPIIVAGGGVTASDARAELVAFAEKLSIPVATSLNAKAMVSEATIRWQ